MLMSADEKGFHEAIRSGDVEARLVYADWLEERGRLEESAMLRSGRWCLVPAGSFWMGGGGGRVGREQVEIPYHFYLGTYPVMQGEWQTVMGSNPSWFSRAGGGKDEVRSISDADLGQFPVEQVSWDDVQEFLAKLNEGKSSSGWLYRLPRDAEWEYACRGGASSKKDCSYHFYLDQPTNDLSSLQANFNGDYPEGKAANGPHLRRTSRVGSYKPNRLGIHDMHGNVWEWCDDLSESGPDRVIRGGCWGNNSSYCFAANRFGHEPSHRSIGIGFRLARVPSGG